MLSSVAPHITEYNTVVFLFHATWKPIAICSEISTVAGLILLVKAPGQIQFQCQLNENQWNLGSCMLRRTPL